MALTLEQYAAYLDTRALPWPTPPPIESPRVKPHVVLLPDIRAVSWSVYGTLLAVPGGELSFVHPKPMIMKIALDKTIQEFKMWGAMTRKPGDPADYLLQVYEELLTEQRGQNMQGEKHPEILVERVWEGWVKRLLKKDYVFDVAFYGGLNEFSQKIAYFFHRNLQATTCYPGAAAALQAIAAKGVMQGLLADAQCFTMVQLQSGLAQQDPAADCKTLLDPHFRVLSCERGVRKPSERLFEDLLAAAAERGIEAQQVLHIGSSLVHDVIPARRCGMRTGLFAGDRAALPATAEQLRGPANRPDLLLGDLQQAAEALT